MRPDQIELLTHLSRPTVHPDGSWAVVATSRPDFASDAYVGQLWRVALDGSSAPRRLTRGRSDGSPAFSPDGSLLGFLRADADGRNQVWVLPTDGGEAVQVTNQKLGVAQFRFSPDGRTIAFVARVADEGRYGTLEGVSASQEDPRRFTGVQIASNGLGWTTDRRPHVFVVELPDPFAEPFVPATGRVARQRSDEKSEATGFNRAVQLTSGDHDDTGIEFSADGGHVLFLSNRHEGSDLDLGTDAYRVPVGGGEVERLTEAPEQLSLDALVTSGAHLFAAGTSVGSTGVDFVGHNSTVWLLDDEPRPLVDPEDFGVEWAPVADGRGGVLVGVGRRGAVHLVRVDAEGTTTPLLEGAVVVQHAVPVPGRDAVLAVVSDAMSAGELCLVSDGRATPLTSFSAPLREATTIVEPVEATATAPDGHPVHGWVLRPAGEGPHPVLLVVHGGPFANFTVDLFDEFQVYVAAGYAVVACNPRGSAGYGQAHGRAIKGDFGRLDLADITAFLDHAVASFDGLDGERVGIMGGSYGGYLTAWTIAHDHRWKGAIVERGYLDPQSFIGASDIGWFFPGEYNTRDRARMDAQSPTLLAGQVATPTLVIHSEEDLRCPISQGLRYYTELKLAGVEAELLVFPGETHELSRSGTPWHRRQRFEAILEWWGRHLPVA